MVNALDHSRRRLHVRPSPSAPNVLSFTVLSVGALPGCKVTFSLRAGVAVSRECALLPKSIQPKVKAALHDVMNAEHKEAADLAVDRFVENYGSKYPKATGKLLKDREVLLTHYDFPAEHWIHLRTTNAIESTFATVRLRTRKTKGAGSRAAGLAIAYKLLDAAQARWRCVNAPHLVALVRAGATFVDGIKVEREDQRNAA